jgi:hypothetical protein
VSRAHRIATVVAAGLAAAAVAAGCGSDKEASDRAGASLPPTSTPTTDATVPVPTGTATTPGGAERAAKRAQRARAQQRKRRAAARRRAEAAEARTETETAPDAPAGDATPAEEPVEPPQQTPAQTPEPQPKPKPTGPPVHTITEQATMQLVSKNGLRSFVHEGAVEGTLTGTINLRTRLGGPGIIGDFTVTLSDGTMRGRATGTVSPSGSKATFKGSASILGGTGAYARASGTGLAFSGHVASDASRSFIRMSGHVRY